MNGGGSAPVVGETEKEVTPHEFGDGGDIREMEQEWMDGGKTVLIGAFRPDGEQVAGYVHSGDALTG